MSNGSNGSDKIEMRPGDSSDAQLTAALRRAVPLLIAGSAYALLSPDGRITSVSADFGAFVPADDALVVGQLLPDVFDAFVGLETEIDALASNGGDPVRIERLNWIRPNRPPRYLDLELHRLDTDQPDLGLLLIIRDTSDVGTLEQALVQERNELRLARAQLANANRDLERLDQLKSIFLAMAAHDIRTPLVVIRGYAELLLQLVDDTESAEIKREELIQYLNTISVQADWLGNLIENIQGLDQIENEQLVLHKAPTDLGAIVIKTVEMLQATTQLNEQTLRHDIPEQAVIVNGDPRRLQQILHNLIGNAVKYTQRKGTIQVTLQQEKSAALLSVHDNGHGMQPEQMAHIFDLYYRTADAQRSPVKGTGLGLYIVKTLVDAHHGTINVESAPGAGTRFDVRLPALP